MKRLLEFWKQMIAWEKRNWPEHVGCVSSVFFMHIPRYLDWARTELQQLIARAASDDHILLLGIKEHLSQASRLSVPGSALLYLLAPLYVEAVEQYLESSVPVYDHLNRCYRILETWASFFRHYLTLLDSRYHHALIQLQSETEDRLSQRVHQVMMTLAKQHLPVIPLWKWPGLVQILWNAQHHYRTLAQESQSLCVTYRSSLLEKYLAQALTQFRQHILQSKRQSEEVCQSLLLQVHAWYDECRQTSHVVKAFPKHIKKHFESVGSLLQVLSCSLDTFASSYRLFAIPEPLHDLVSVRDFTLQQQFQLKKQ